MKQEKHSVRKVHQWDCKASSWCSQHAHKCRVCGIEREAPRVHPLSKTWKQK